MAHMRVRVDQRLCEAHALCVEIAPTVFDLGDDIATCDPAPDESLRGPGLVVGVTSVHDPFHSHVSARLTLLTPP